MERYEHWNYNKSIWGEKMKYLYTKFFIMLYILLLYGIYLRGGVIYIVVSFFSMLGGFNVGAYFIKEKLEAAVLARGQQ